MIVCQLSLEEFYWNSSPEIFYKNLRQYENRWHFNSEKKTVCNIEVFSLVTFNDKNHFHYKNLKRKLYFTKSALFKCKVKKFDIDEYKNLNGIFMSINISLLNWF